MQPCKAEAHMCSLLEGCASRASHIVCLRIMRCWVVGAYNASALRLKIAKRDLLRTHRDRGAK